MQVVIAIHGGAFEMIDAFKDGEPKVQQRMVAFLKDLTKKKLGVAVFFMLPNANEVEKIEAEKLLHKGGFKGLYSGSILTTNHDPHDTDDNKHGIGGGNSGSRESSPGKGCTPDEIRKHLESRRFHIVANMAMEPSWLTGASTDMHVHLKEEKEENGFGPCGRSRSRALSYSSQSSEEELGLPDLSSDSSDDNDLGLPPLSDLMGDSSGSSSDNDLGIPPLSDLLGDGSDGSDDSSGSGGRRGRRR